MKHQLKSFFVYMLKCADGSFYIGMTTSLQHRLAEHHSGADPNAYTFSRRPLTFVWSQHFATWQEAFNVERQLKGWSRAKKEALFRNDWETLHKIVKSQRTRKERSKRR